MHFRIALIHSQYATGEVSGENMVVRTHDRVLKNAGHDVRLFTVSSPRNPSLFYKIRKFIEVSLGIGFSFSTEIKKFNPDVIIVHNVFPNIGYSWMNNCEAPIIQFLHNYRYFCANGIFFRKSEICFQCVDKSPFQSVIHACYKDSRVATLPIYLQNFSRKAKQFKMRTPIAYVVLSQAYRERVVKFGIPNEKIEVISNFSPKVQPSLIFDEEIPRWLISGRLEPAKGIFDLVKIWPDEVPLDIIGEGPESDELRIFCNNKGNLNFIGPISHQEFLKKLSAYQGAVFASKCFDVNPLTLIEYLSVGLPIINVGASVNTPGLEHAFHVPRTGGYIDSQALKSAIAQASAMRSVVSEKSRSTFNEKYSEDAWITKFENLLVQVTSFYSGKEN